MVKVRGEGGSEHPRVEIQRNKVTYLSSLFTVVRWYLDRSIYPPELLEEEGRREKRSKAEVSRSSEIEAKQNRPQPQQ